MYRKLYCEKHFYESVESDASKLAFDAKDDFKKDKHPFGVETEIQRKIERGSDGIHRELYEYIVRCYHMYPSNQWEA